MLTVRGFKKKYENGTLALEENGAKIHGKIFGEKGRADAPGGSHLDLIWMVLKHVREPKLLDGYRIKFVVGDKKNIRIRFVSCNARRQKKENFDVVINEPGWRNRYGVYTARSGWEREIGLCSPANLERYMSDLVTGRN